MTETEEGRATSEWDAREYCVQKFFDWFDEQEGFGMIAIRAIKMLFTIGSELPLTRAFRRGETAPSEGW